MNANAERLARSFSELVELQLVLEKASAFFDDAQHHASASAFETRPADGRAVLSINLPYHVWLIQVDQDMGYACQTF